jgi:AcrR family transcriptional regulator
MFANVNQSASAPGSAEWWRDRYLQRLRARGRALNMEQIGRAALKIVDEDGLRELTMRRLADELGTGPASLYRHVSSRDDLLVEVADLVLGELHAPDPGLHWREALEQLAHDLRRVLVGHRGLVVVSSNAPLLGPNAMRIRGQGNTAWTGEENSGLDELLDILPARRFPTVLKFSDYVDKPDLERDFSFGLRALLNGLWQSQQSGDHELGSAQDLG